MNLLIADPSGGVWETCGAAAPLRAVPCEVPQPCVLCAASGCAAICSAQQRDCVCLRRRDWREICRMPAVPGVNGVCLSPCERYLYQLSGEADCVHTRSLATGQLLFAAPTGVFPRCMCLAPGGRHLLVAGGAVDEGLSAVRARAGAGADYPYKASLLCGWLLAGGPFASVRRRGG